MTISELYTAQKKQNARRSLVGSVKFGSVALPLMLILTAPPWFKAHAQIPVYQRDCRSAPLVGDWRTASTPCYLEAAVGHLKIHHKGGQDLLLDFPDGRSEKLGVDGEIWTHAQADGSCSVERWHGQITAVLRPGAKMLARHNPELDGGSGQGLFLAFVSAFMLSLWAYAFILWKRGDLKQKTMQ